MLSESKLSEAISAVPWLAFPGRIADEINRAHPKLNNALLHIIDGTGLHIKANTYIPVGMPYEVDDEMKRYSFTIATSNPRTTDYGGTYSLDAALERRIVLTINLDDVHPSTSDVVQLIRERRPKGELPQYTPMTESVIRVYESLADTMPVSPLATLLQLYFSGYGTCIRTRSGRMNPVLQPAICDKCHLGKSSRFCRNVSGVSEGLLLWVKEIAAAIAAVRAAKILEHVRADCLADRHTDLQSFMESSAKGENLFDEFREWYIENLSVLGEDVVAAYSLVAPGHVSINLDWMNRQEQYEKSESLAFSDIATSSWQTLQSILRSRQDLFSELAANGDLTPARQADVETLVTTVDCAMLSVIAALRDDDLRQKFRSALVRHPAA
jgi:hypothetical protein